MVGVELAISSSMWHMRRVGVAVLFATGILMWMFVCGIWMGAEMQILLTRRVWSGLVVGERAVTKATARSMLRSLV